MLCCAKICSAYAQVPIAVKDQRLEEVCDLIDLAVHNAVGIALYSFQDFAWYAMPAPPSLMRTSKQGTPRLLPPSKPQNRVSRDQLGPARTCSSSRVILGPARPPR